MGKKERVKVNAYFINHLNGQRVLCNVHVEEGKRIRGGTEAGESKEEEEKEDEEDEDEDEERKKEEEEERKKKKKKKEKKEKEKGEEDQADRQ